VAPERFELRVEPRTDRFDPDDDRWRDQVSAFYRELDDEVGGVHREHVGVAGTKGGLETVVLALGSAGAFTAAVEVVRSWLGRDRSRSLDIAWSSEGATRRVTVRGEHIDGSALRALAEAAAHQIGGGEWSTSPTAPS